MPKNFDNRIKSYPNIGISINCNQFPLFLFSGIWYNLLMEKKAILTEEQLNQVPKDVLVSLYLQLADTMKQVSRQNAQLLLQVSNLEDKIDILTQRYYGRKTEKASEIDGLQISFDFDADHALNEAEHILDESSEDAAEDNTKSVCKRSKRKGKRKSDLQHLETVIDEHTVSEEKLAEVFPHGYDILPYHTYYTVEYIPAKFIEHEHHVFKYAGKRGEGILVADAPEKLLPNSILTPSLAAGVFCSKYLNAVPLTRLAEDFERLDMNISRQTLANWMIAVSDRYLEHIYGRMHQEILKSRLIHCDETPFKLVEQGKAKNSKAYMWVYHTMETYGSPPIFLYDHKGGRSSAIPREFLKDYQGILVTDGYQVYHKLANERPDELKVAGCWAHCKRKFDDVVKALKTTTLPGSIAAEAHKRIAAIYHVDNMFKQSSEEERLDNRQKSVKPLVDAFFDWIKSIDTTGLDKSGSICGAINYAINQESYLRAFLDDAIIPLDNNDAERSIKKFCVGKHSWHIIASTRGARASAILYSIAETAKANGLKPHEYFKYLLEGMLAHLDDKPSDYIDDLLPWSDKIPEYCRLKKFE